MKLIIPFMIMFISITSALALYGGETWTYHFDECDKLRVNITGNLTIDNGEYTINNDCYNESKDYWICNCSNDFDFNISFKTNAINNYTLKFNYDYSREEVIEEEDSDDGGSSGSSGGGGSYSTHWDCKKWGSCINGKSTRYCYSGSGVKSTETRNCTVEKKASPTIDKAKEPETVPIELGNVTEAEAMPPPIKKPISSTLIIISLILLMIVIFGFMFWKYS